MQALKFIICLILFGFLSACNDEPASSSAVESPIEIKVVVVTMFEIGEDQGDKAGEFQLWKAGQKLDTCLPFPVSHHDICINPQSGVMGIVTGMGIAKATAAIMALGLDPRFDLSHAYWLVAGIAGFDPADASIGSAAWATWLVDGDLAHEIDGREIPTDWPTGYFPLFANEPVNAGTGLPAPKLSDGYSANGEVYKLNEKLTDWAFNLTKDLKLSEYPAMFELREKYTDHPNAQRPPFVLKGDHLASSTFWHGKLMNQWANDWTSYWTQGEGNFVSSGMEDTGAYQAMVYLARANLADRSRFMVLRTASNYSMQPPDLTAVENLSAESGEAGFAGLLSSVESAYTVGSKVVDTIVANWAQFKTTMPYDASNIITPATKPVSEVQAQLPAQQTTKLTTQQLVDALQLEGHVEGGYFRQTFKADHRPTITTKNGDRVTMTSIYYLLSAESPIGHFHMNQSDIMHYFHAGDPITYYLIQADGELQTVVMGSDPTQGQVMQTVVKGGTWKASKIPTDGDFGYGLIGEAVAPGFEYSDMQLGQTTELVALFPQHAELIKSLSR
ncbi:cupin domain-containing protein [Paraglaciecola hydrolytica]|uniref:Purine nucleoside permease n=1 Tax=Paraglaciecola hydrolytica TaxID=1799789 RepID=A0A148KN88_9ALTE|nr:cupin domain-containing protein [Paraglaciecola hydrolytica]KXI27719.1 purine nucleoside permease [Paraglaciecola hydrolytica]